MTNSIEQLKQQNDTDGIVTALGDESAEVRLAAAQALGDMYALRAVDALSAALQDSTPAVRQAAAQALGKIGDRRTGTSLVTALKDDDPEVRQAVVQSLGHMGGIRVIRPLVGMLKDVDGRVQGAAKIALRAKAISVLRSRWTWIILVAILALAIVIIRFFPTRSSGPLATLTKGGDTWELLDTETTQTIRTGGLSDIKAPPGQVLLQVHFRCVTHNVLASGSPVYVVDSQGAKYPIAYYEFSYPAENLSVPAEKKVPETLTLTYSVPENRSGFQLLFFDLPPIGLGR